MSSFPSNSRQLFWIGIEGALDPDLACLIGVDVGCADVHNRWVWIKKTSIVLAYRRSLCVDDVPALMESISLRAPMLKNQFAIDVWPSFPNFIAGLQTQNPYLN